MNWLLDVKKADLRKIRLGLVNIEKGEFNHQNIIAIGPRMF